MAQDVGSLTRSSATSRRPRGDPRGEGGLEEERRREVRGEDAAAARALHDVERRRRPRPRHAGRRAHRLPARSRLARRVPVHARRAADDVPRPPLDDAHVRGLRHARADQRALQVPARAGADGPLDRLRFPDAHGLRQRLAALARRGRHVRRRGRHAARHGGALRPDPARQGHDVDDHQRSGDRAALRSTSRSPTRAASRAQRSAARCRTTASRSSSRSTRGSSRRAPRCAS